MNIIHVEIVQGDIEHRLPLGDFADAFVTEMKSIQFKSKIFSTKGIVDSAELEKEQRAALDRVIQKIRDGGYKNEQG